jgi:hypothetical protein
MTHINRLIDLMRRAQQRAASERSLVMPTSYSSNAWTAGTTRRGVSHTLLCLSCKYYNPTTQAYLRCAVHPEGPESDTFCPDQEPRP